MYAGIIYMPPKCLVLFLCIHIPWIQNWKPVLILVCFLYRYFTKSTPLFQIPDLFRMIYSITVKIMLGDLKSELPITELHLGFTNQKDWCRSLLHTGRLHSANERGHLLKQESATHWKTSQCKWFSANSWYHGLCFLERKW